MGSTFYTGLTKVAVGDNSSIVATWAPPNCFPCGPIFVPRPGGSQEDDGVVLSIVLSGNLLHNQYSTAICTEFDTDLKKAIEMSSKLK